MRHFLFAFLIGAASLAQAAADLPAGPYGVGFRVVQQYDYSRVYKTSIDFTSGEPTSGERARPVQTLVWYPAQAGGTPFPFRDYIATSVAPDKFDTSAAEVQRATDALAKALTREPRIEASRQLIAQTVLARRDAPPRAGKYPVVIYAPSLSAPAAENADLCEYLASQGYVVLASPSIGARSRFMTGDLEGAEAQAGDITFLLGYAHSLPQADVGRVGVVGFSWGGLANVLAAARDDRIKALVSLDGSLRGHREFVDGGKDAARYVTPARLAVPLMYIARRPSTLEELNTNEVDSTFSLMNRMKHADVHVLTMHPMQHPDFSSWTWRFNRDKYFDEYSRDEVKQAYSWTVRYVHQFLAAHLEQDAAARTFINNSPRDNKTPPHMLTQDVRKGDGAPPTMESFVRQLNARGFAQAYDIYSELKAKDANFTPGDPNALNNWAYQLLRSGREKQAVELFRFAVRLNPADANLFDSLAEACEKTGATQEAIQHYRRSLELNPKNSNAAERLKALQAQS